MKKLFILLFVLFTYVSFSQNQKIGHINTSDILSKMPEVDTAKAKLKRISDMFQEQYQSLVNEYQTKSAYLSEHQKDMTQPVVNDKKRELDQLAGRIKKFQDDAQKELDSNQRKFFDPIINHLHTVVNQVAVEKGYDYILDTASGIVLFSKDSDDISVLVKKKLGLP